MRSVNRSPPLPPRSSLKAGSANGAVPADLSGLENRLSQLEAGQQQTAVDPAAVSDLQAKLASANQAIDQLKSDLAGRVEKLTENQTEVSDKVSAIETKINKPRDDIEVARAIAASALKTAADREDRSWPSCAHLAASHRKTPPLPLWSLMPRRASPPVSSCNGNSDRLLTRSSQPSMRLRKAPISASVSGPAPCLSLRSGRSAMSKATAPRRLSHALRTRSAMAT